MAPDKEHDRQRDLDDEQRATNPAAAGPGRSSAAFLEHRPAAAAACHAGSQPEENPGDSEAPTRTENGAVDRKSRDAGNAAGAERLNRLDREVASRRPTAAARDREHQALGQHLQHQAAPRRAERRTNGDLLCADRRARRAAGWRRWRTR